MLHLLQVYKIHSFPKIRAVNTSQKKNVGSYRLKMIIEFLGGYYGLYVYRNFIDTRMDLYIDIIRDL